MSATQAKMEQSMSAIEREELCEVGRRQESLLERYSDDPETLAKFAGERAEFIMAALENFASGGGKETLRMEKRSAGYGYSDKGKGALCIGDSKRMEKYVSCFAPRIHPPTLT